MSAPVAFDSSFIVAVATEIAKWIVPLAGAFIAVFFTPLLDKIKLRLNRADLSAKQFEEFACDLSAFIFNAELMYEFRTNGWDIDQLVDGYNTSVTTFRTKEFVYLSWARRFWTAEEYPMFEKVIASVRKIDEAVHRFNDGRSDRERIAAIGDEIVPLRGFAKALLVPNK
ncbi:hypothetical protein [Undibacterium terreum]|uniref:Uncharacterized protein n=1 Tax=Undibacterium terreum TaxID=1224302 RepID=A0A916XRT0_9BURK|nr:hypothetical protein [Undibacterium terreum]GGC93515.1 hypothetical protein GCM10011396_46000 [Undibacterium terreum]